MSEFLTVERRSQLAMEQMLETFTALLARYPGGVPLPFVANEPELAGSAVTTAAARRGRAQLGESVAQPLRLCCTAGAAATTPTERIGNHFSPLVGLMSPLRLHMTSAAVAAADAADATAVAEDDATLFGKRTLQHVDGFLPLAMFADEHFATVGALPVADVMCKCKAQHADPNAPGPDFEWLPGTAVAFHDATLAFDVVLAESGVRRTVTRLSLRLPGESLEAHAEAVAASRRDRRQHERRLRLDMYLHMVHDDAAERPLPAEALQRILHSASVGVGAVGAYRVQQHVDRLRDEYAAAMKRIRFEYFCLDPYNVRMLAPLDLLLPDPATCIANEVAAIATQEGSVTTRAVALRTETGKFNFKRIQAALSDSFRWSSPTKECLLRIRAVWFSKYDRLLLTDVRCGRQPAIAYAGFMKAMANALEAGTMMLRLQYNTDVDGVMVEVLKGHFSYSHLTIESFRASRLGAFFNVVRAVMSNRLREVAAKSLNALTAFLTVKEEPVAATYGAHSDAFYVIPGYRRTAAAQVVLQLQVTAKGVEVSPTPAQLRTDLLEVITDIVATTANVDCLENIVMSALNLPKACIPCLHSESPEVLAAVAAVEAITERLAPFVQTVTLAYSRFVDTASAKTEPDFFAPERLKDTSALIAEFAAHRDVMERVQWASPDELHCAMFQLDCGPAKRELLEAWQGRTNALLHLTERRVEQVCALANTEFEDIDRELSTRPTNAEEMQRLMTFSVKALRTLDRIESHDCKHALGWVQVLEGVFYALPPALTHDLVQMCRWPAQLDQQFAASEALVRQERQQMVAELDAAARAIRVKIDRIAVQIDDLFFVCDVERIDQTETTVRAIRAVLETIRDEIATLHNRQDIFELARSNFDMLFAISNNFEAVEQFWLAVKNSTVGVQAFLDTPLAQLNADDLVNHTQEWRRLLRASTRALRGFPETYNIGRTTEAQLARFMEVHAVVELLKVPGMRPAHFKELSKRMGLLPGSELLPMDPNFTLQKLIDVKAAQHEALVAEVSRHAVKEFEIESRLDKMKVEARTLRLQFGDVADNAAIRLLSNAGELSNVLDHFLALTAQMRMSPFVGAHLAAVNEWEALIARFSETIALWAGVQEQWLQLNPVMVQTDAVGAPPAQQQQQQQSKVSLQYANADALFRSIVDEVDRTQHSILTVMVLETLPLRLKEIDALLHNVRTEVVSLMGEKRGAFSRFYFISDEQMLTCLSSADLGAITPLFQFMYYRLSHLETSGSDVVAFVSGDGVRLQCDQPVAITNEPIETWMTRLDRALKAALSTNLDLALKEFPRTPLRTWLFKWSGQFVDLVLRIRFTADLEDVVRVTGHRGLPAYIKKMNRVVEEYAQLARSRATMKAAELLVLSNSVMHELHSRDLVATMIKEKISTVDELTGFPMFRTTMDADHRCHVKLFHVESRYGFEFCGNTAGSLVTPEYFRSARGVALSAIFGGHNMLLGRHGSGKSELLRGLALLYGRFFWSFQCLPGTTLESFATILRGCLNVGAFLAFEDVDLLTDAAAFQLGQVARDVAAARRAPAGEHVRLGSGMTSVLNPEFAFFCTSRLSSSDVHAKLHPLLVSQFRPLHVQLPEFAECAKMFLHANGLETVGNALGNKLGRLFSGCHSAAPAVFTLARLSAVVKHASVSDERNHPDLALVAALQRLVRPAIPDAVQPLFDEELTVFDVAHTPAHRLQSQPTASVAHLQLLLDTFDHVIIAGATFSGKTALMTRALDQAATQLIRISPRALTSRDLYGTYTTRGSDQVWQPGCLDHVAKACSTPGSHYVCFEGMLAAYDEFAWLPTFDRQRRAVCCGGTSNVVSIQTQVIFKTTSLAAATPRLVSRCGVLCATARQTWQEVLQGTLTRHHSTVLMAPYLMRLAEVVVTVMIDITASVPAFARAGSAQAQVFVAGTMFRPVLADVVNTAQLLSEHLERHVQAAFQTFLFCLVWAFGGALTPKLRVTFEEELQAVVDVANQVCKEVDASVDLFPSSEGALFTSHVTLSGWRALRTTAGSVPTTFTPAPAQPVWKQLCPHAAAHANGVLTQYFAQFTGLLLIGRPESGKSTLLGSTARHFTDATATFRLTAHSTTHDALHATNARLARRAAGVFGPSGARKLLLLVDDLHLPRAPSPSGGADENAFMELLCYIQHHKQFMSPDHGVVGLQDVTALAVADDHTGWEDRHRRAFLTLRVAPLAGSHWLGMLRQLADAATSPTPHLAALGQQAMRFAVEVHQACLTTLKQRGAGLPLTLMLQTTDTLLALFGTKASDAALPKCFVAEVYRAYLPAVGDGDAPWLQRLVETQGNQHFAALSDDAMAAAKAGDTVENFSEFFVVHEPDGAVERLTQKQMFRRVTDGLERYNERTPRTAGDVLAEEKLRAVTPSQSSFAAVPSEALVGEAARPDTADTAAGAPQGHSLFVSRSLLHHTARLLPQLRAQGVHCCLVTDDLDAATSIVGLTLEMHGCTVVSTGKTDTSGYCSYGDWCDDVNLALRVAVRPCNDVAVVVHPKLFALRTPTGQSVADDIDAIVRANAIPPHIARDDEFHSAVDGTTTDRLPGHLKFVCILESDADAAALFAEFPAFRAMSRYSICDVNTDESLVETARYIFEQAPQLEGNAAPYAEVATQLFSAVRQEVAGTPSAWLAPAQFPAFVRLVTKLHALREPDVRRMLEQHSVLARTVATLQQDEAGSRGRKEVLLPQLAAMVDELLTEERRVAALADDVDVQKREFQGVESSTVTMVSVLEGKKHSIQQLNEAVRVQVADARAGLQEMDGKLVTNLRLSINPPQKIKSLMEGVCMLLGERPEKNVRGSVTPDYWTLARRLMEDALFIDKLLALDVNADAMPAYAAFEPVIEVCETNRFTTFSPFAQALADWTLAMGVAIKYKGETDQLGDEVQGGQEEMLKVVEGLENRRDRLTTASKTLTRLRFELERLRATRTRLQGELEVCELRLLNSSRVVALVSALSAQYHDEHVEARELDACLVANLFMSALSLSVLMALPAAAHAACAARAVEVLAAHELPLTASFSIRRVLSPELRMLRHEVRGVTLPPQLTNALTALTLRMLPHCAFFVTSFRFVAPLREEQLRATFHDVVATPLNDAKTAGVIAAAAASGAVVVVTDVFGPIPASWCPLFDASDRAKGFTSAQDSLTVTFGAERTRVTVRAGFHVVFVSHCNDRPLLEHLTYVRCDDEPGLVEEVFAQLLLPNRPDTTVDEDFGVALRELQRIEERKLRSGAAVSLLVRTHGESIVEHTALIDELDEQISEWLRAKAQAAETAEGAAAFDLARRAPCRTTASVMHAVLGVLGTMSAALPLASQPCLGVFCDLVSRAFLLNRSVTVAGALQKLLPLSALDQQRVVSVAFVHAVIDMFAPSYSVTARPLFFALLSATVAAHPLFHASKAADWLTPGGVECFAYIAASQQQGVEAVLDAVSERFGEEPTAVAVLMACGAVSADGDDDDGAGLDPLSGGGADPLAALLVALVRRRTADHRDLMALFDAVAMQCGGAFLLTRGAGAKQLAVGDVRVDSKYAIHFAEATGVPLMVACAPEECALAVLSVQRRAYADQCLVVVEDALDRSDPYHLAAAVEAQVCREVSSASCKGVWHVIVVRDDREAAQQAEFAVSALREMQRRSKFAGRDSVYQLWLILAAAPHDSLAGHHGGGAWRERVLVAGGGGGDRAAGHWRFLMSVGLRVTLGAASVKDHLMQCITVGPAYPRDWRDNIDTPIGRLVQCVVLFHCALLQRQRLATFGSIYPTFFDDAELSIVLAIVRAALSGAPARALTEPFVVLRYVVFFIYGMRVASQPDLARLNLLVGHFLDTEALRGSFRYAGLLPVTDGDLYEMNQRAVAMPVSLAELSLCAVDVDALVAVVRAQRFMELATAVPPSDTPIHAVDARRASVAAASNVLRPAPPGAPAKAMSLAARGIRKAFVFGAGKLSTSTALWQVEESSLGKTEVSSAYARVGAGASEAERQAHAAHRRFVAHARDYLAAVVSLEHGAVRSVWLPALMFPDLFIARWLNAQAQAAAGDGTPFRAPQVHVVVLPDGDTVRDTDCVLQGATFMDTGDITTAVLQAANGGDAEGKTCPVVVMRVGERAMRSDLTVSAMLPQLATNLGRRDPQVVLSSQNGDREEELDETAAHPTEGELVSETPCAVVVVTSRTRERGVATTNGGIGIRVVYSAPVFVVAKKDNAFVTTAPEIGEMSGKLISPGMSSASLASGSMGSEELAQLLRDEGVGGAAGAQTQLLTTTIGMIQSVIIPY
jgi:hypothetical protein